jgi:hypothetical protein
MPPMPTRLAVNRIGPLIAGAGYIASVYRWLVRVSLRVGFGSRCLHVPMSLIERGRIMHLARDA